MWPNGCRRGSRARGVGGPETLDALSSPRRMGPCKESSMKRKHCGRLFESGAQWLPVARWGRTAARRGGHPPPRPTAERRLATLSLRNCPRLATLVPSPPSYPRPRRALSSGRAGHPDGDVRRGVCLRVLPCFCASLGLRIPYGAYAPPRPTTPFPRTKQGCRPLALP